VGVDCSVLIVPTDEDLEVSVGT